MAKPQPLLLGSAPTLLDILDVIQAFYCGGRKDVQADPMEPNVWGVYHPKGDRIVTVRVRRVVRRRVERFLFEKAPL